MKLDAVLYMEAEAVLPREVDAGAEGMSSHLMVLQAGRVCSRYSFCTIRLEV